MRHTLPWPCDRAVSFVERRKAAWEQAEILDRKYFNSRNLTKWRGIWKDEELAFKKKWLAFATLIFKAHDSPFTENEWPNVRHRFSHTSGLPVRAGSCLTRTRTEYPHREFWPSRP
jgi:hypothetical protein